MAPLTTELAQRVLHFIHQVDRAPKIDISDLRHLQVPFYGFDGQEHLGDLIVHRVVAEEVEQIFLELFHAHFPIEKIRLIEEYGADDNASMEDNNSSAFCYRFAVAKPQILSKHSFGLAIDVNPLYNPYVKKELILPKNGARFTDRTIDTKGMIRPGDRCHQAFCKRGWTWGGSWPDRQDYQHFEKEIPLPSF
jgi:hypothetical protein